MNNDLISREDLRENIERIKQNVVEWVNHTECDTTKALVKISLFEEFIDLIDDAPTVTPTLPTEVKKALEVLNRIEQNKWVPVSEKLPPNYIICLFCDTDGNIFCGHRKSNNLWYEEYQTDSISDVIAWQELPKPYKKGGAEWQT